jgi:Tfp pilus assembly major pilin PilA
MWYDRIWNIWYIYLLTAIGLTPGDSSTVQYTEQHSSTVHIYTQTVHRTTQKYDTHLHTNSAQNNTAVRYTFTHKQYTEQHSSTVHIYTQTVHRTTQQYRTHLHTNSAQNNTAVQYIFTHKQYTEQHSSTVHIYAQTVHRTTEWNRIHRILHT